MKKFRIIMLIVAGLFIAGTMSFVTADAVSQYEGEMIHHPTDATKYYIFINGVWIEQQCPDGLVFDCYTQSCTFPGWDCGHILYVGTVSADGINGVEGELMHHPKDATKYLQYSQGAWYEKQCAAPLVFDCITRACVVPGTGCNCFRE